MGAPPSETPPTAAMRCASIDVFRGFVILAMLLVNAIHGRDFAPQTLHHADWRVGALHASLADLVAPWFLLAVGLALPFSMHGGRGRNSPLSSKLLVALRRMAILFILGGIIEVARIAFREHVSWRTLISVDVLPQIGIGYFLAVLLYSGPRWSRPAFITLVFLSKWLLLAHWPYPGTDHPVWTPEQNMQDFLRAKFPLFKGLHGALVAAAIVCLGTYAGDWLRNGRAVRRDAPRLAAYGAVLVAISLAWSFDLPYSRYYHTPTWALLASGTGCLILALFHAASAQPVAGRILKIGFEAAGKNPLTVYIIAELLWPLIDPLERFKRAAPERTCPWDAFEHLLARIVGDAAAPWLQVGLYIAAFWLLARILDRKRLYLRV